MSNKKPANKKQMVRKAPEVQASMDLIDLDRQILELSNELDRLLVLKEQLIYKYKPCSYLC